MIELIIVIVVWLILGFVGSALLYKDLSQLYIENGDVAFLIFLTFLGPMSFVSGIIDYFILVFPNRKKKNWKITDWLNKKSKERRND